MSMAKVFKKVLEQYPDLNRFLLIRDDYRDGVCDHGDDCDDCSDCDDEAKGKKSKPCFCGKDHKPGGPNGICLLLCTYLARLDH